MRLGERVRGWATGAIEALAGAALLLGLGPALAAAPAPAASSAAAAPSAPRPAIWLLEDEDTRIYLFGTTHIFERGFAWRSRRLDAAIREADELVMETADEERIDDAALARWLFMPKAVPILWRVSTDRRARLAELIAASDIPMEVWDMLDTWAAGMMLMGMQMMEGRGDEGGRELSGAELELSAEFRRAGKPISAVETSEQQVEMFRSLSRTAQRQFLESMIDGWLPEGDQAAAAPAGDAAWASGDVEAIGRDMEAFTPELYDALLVRRNRAWTEWLSRRLERPGTVLFAVGAGHLAGRDSVQTMLAERGLRARRID